MMVLSESVLADTLAVLSEDRLEDIVAWRLSGPVSGSQFLAQASALAEALPEAAWALNACEDRYQFMLAFVALALRGQVNLLPSNAAPESTRRILRAHPNSYFLTDQTDVDPALRSFRVPEKISGGSAGLPNRIPASATIAIAYTSGSTGEPQPHAKTWLNLVATCRLAAERLSWGVLGLNIVGTVPSQHMYGLELTIMLALAAGCRATASRPFYPRDVAEALAAVPEPRLLVTTPLHLRSLIASGVSLPRLAGIVSATAPLSKELCLAVEHRFAAPIIEIYGCTEAGSLATRRTSQESLWLWHTGTCLQQIDGISRIEAGQLDTPLVLQDRLEKVDSQRFRLLGRNEDLIKVAGKRASLSELTARLLAIDGVEDAAVFLPTSPTGSEERPAALIVAPNLNRPQILAILADGLDPVLVPRPLILMDRLPRNSVGKLTISSLQKALETHHDR